MRNVLFVTGQHFAEAPRKVDLHFLADALNAEGDHADFLSLRLSQVSRFSSEGRWEYARSRICNAWVKLSDLRDEYIWVSLVHPFAMRYPLLNWLSGRVFRHYGMLLPDAVRKRLPAYTHILVESGIGALLTPYLRKYAPNARIIYHAADQLQTIGAHPCFEEVLRASAQGYDLIHILAEDQRKDMPGGVPVLLLRHGISKDVFDKAVSNPYSSARNAVSVGDMLFDQDVLKALARSNPDWTFHLFGRKAQLDTPVANVIAHGETPFETVAGYIRHADIGIAPYQDGKGASYLSQSSLKMIQYTYCRLPIVAPLFAAAGRAHVCGYEPGNDASILAAFEAAKHYNRAIIDTNEVMSWVETARVLFG